MKSFLRLICFALILSLGPSVLAETIEAADEQLTYEQHIRPLLKEHCFACHGETGNREGGLDLRLKRLILAGGESGATLVPGDRTESYLYEQVESGDMPPGDAQLSPEHVELIGRWIDAGAVTLRPEPDEIGDGYYFTEDERSFWAFQPVQAVEVPELENTDRIRAPIDAFLQARMEPAGLSFAVDADKVTLLRRACFDLLGLPPTPEQVRLFLADEANDAYERLLDRLLASPHYGERWGRHWLDTAGYAESEGYHTTDVPRPHAFRYRDYVIRSFNTDKPLDQFIREQLAGDEMVAPPYDKLTPEQIELLTATGFLRMAADGTAAGDVDQGVARNQVVADTISIVTSTLLGLTVGCAQCHDHRYDPIPQDDYYRLRAIFEPAYDWKNWLTPNKRTISLYTDADRAVSKQLEAEAAALAEVRTAKQNEFIAQTREKELAKLDAEISKQVRAALELADDKRTEEQQKLLRTYPATRVTAGSLYLYDPKAADKLKEMAAEVKAVRDKKPVEGFIRCLTEKSGQVPETFLFVRGDHEQPGESLKPAALTILDFEGSEDIQGNNPELPETGRRLAYANHVTDARHPLTARVLVNRIWLHHFGRGIVTTPGDFGALGARPTHPELLDWLATDLVSGGWRMKRLHKLMMMSTAYRQSSDRVAEADSVAEDTLYSRWRIRRLEAEVIRDSIILLSGKLEPQMFGKAVPIHKDNVGQVVVGINTNDSAGRPTGKVISLEGQEFRRSVYITVRRSQPLAVLNTFDAPIMEPNCDLRSASTVTPQALLLLNSPFIHSLADHFANRVAREAESESTSQAKLAWQLAYSRLPNEEQLKDAVTYLDELAAHYQEALDKKPAAKETDKEAAKEKNVEPAPARRALTSFCQALLSSNRFLYVD